MPVVDGVLLAVPSGYYGTDLAAQGIHSCTPHLGCRRCDFLTNL